MDIDKKNTYNSPKGKHRALIVDASIQRESNGEESLRIIYELLSATHRVFNYMARKVYKKADSGELLEELYDLLGNGIDNIIPKNRQICEEGLQMLRWLECDIEIEHIISPRHSQPFCKVTRMTKAGDLIQWSPEEEQGEDDEKKAA